MTLSRTRGRSASGISYRLATPAILAATLGLAGCATPPNLPFTTPRNELALESQSHVGRSLRGQFDHAVYSHDGETSVTIVLVQGAIEAPTQAAVVRMFWSPRAGATPIETSATNASVQYLVFPDVPGRQEVGVYSGAGYLFPNTRLGGGTLRAGLWEANVRLADRSGGFVDPLGKAILTGGVTARRDDAAVQNLIRQLNEAVSARLGYPRLVDAGRALADAS